jgi:hypothetical protein
MTTRIKNSANRFALILLSAAIFGIAGCATPNPLVGWQKDYDTRPDDPIIEKDCNDFIRTFQPVGQRPAQVTGIFKDGTGQHAANIEIFEYHQNASWQYVLIYDKDDKRIKVIKYGYTKYQS